MISPDYCRLFARYNRWMNEKTYAAAAQLPDGTRKRNMGAFFKSIHGTLNHLMVGDRTWMSRFDGEPAGVTSLDQELYSNFDELRAQRVHIDNRIDRFFAQVTDTQIASMLSYVRMRDRLNITLPYSVALVHFFNHQTHHRGQVSTLLMQCGIDVGATDLINMPADFQSPVFDADQINQHQ